MEYNYTIIIPHKNIPDLLTRCLASIPRREDIQIIIIDDNSSKEIVDFEHFPGIGEPCVEIYYPKEGKGAGFARNIGLSHAKGKWLLFVDADDFLVTDALQKMDEFVNSEADVVYFHLMDRIDLANIPFKSDDIIDLKRALSYNAMLCLDESILPLEHNIPVGKMVKHTCVEENKLFFDEISCANDIMFFTKLAFCVKQIEVSDKYLYCVSKPVTHNLTSRKDFESGRIRLKTLLARNQLLQEHGLKKRITPPLALIWQFRHLGVKAILYYCWLVINSSTSIFTGFSKFLRKPMVYINHSD